MGQVRLGKQGKGIDPITRRVLALQGEMSNAEFGERIGVSGEAVGKYRAGSYGVSVAALQGAAKEFGISADYLLTGKGPKKRVLPGEAEQRLAAARDVLSMDWAIVAHDASELVLRALRAQQSGEEGPEPPTEGGLGNSA